MALVEYRRHLELSASLDAAKLAQSKAEAAAKAAAARAADARAARDAAARDLEHASSEATALASELSALRPRDAKLVPEGADARHGAPWPRTAFLLRGGHVLHTRACCGQDVARCVTLRYENHAQLEEYARREGTVLCRACGVDPGF
eukprot:354691-Chlamydomonas_euryale.AAC.21